MTRLAEALRRLGLDGRVGPSGRWVELEGERCRVYVAASPRNSEFYTWCDDPEERAVEHYQDPVEAIEAGLRRAAERSGDGRHDG